MHYGLELLYIISVLTEKPLLTKIFFIMIINTCFLFTVDIYSDCLGSGQCYTVNASSWLGPPYLVEPIYGVIMPLMLTVTLIFNTSIILVLTRPHMVTATNTVLLGMAVCDLMTILLPAPSYIYYYTLGVALF